MNHANATGATERLHIWEQLIEYQLSENLGHAAPRIKIFCYNRVDSTMNKAREVLKELSAGESALLLAARQSEGRGRQGRTWSEAGEGFYATFVFCEELQIEKMSGFSLAVGTVLQTLFADLGFPAKLKWPNDVLDEQGRKLAGILIEVLPSESLLYVLVGIGVNLRGAPAQLQNAVALDALCSRNVTPPDLAALLIEPLSAAWRRFLRHGFSPFREGWCRAAYNLWGTLQIACGAELLCGKFVGVSECGSLLLESGGQLKEISSGEIAC